VHVLDLQEGAERWMRPTVSGQSPEPREMHAACMLPRAGASAAASSSGGGGGGGDSQTQPAAANGDEAAAAAAGDWGGDHEMIVVGGRGRGGVLSDVVGLCTLNSFDPYPIAYSLLNP
jgi:hypothetical protein